MHATVCSWDSEFSWVLLRIKSTVNFRQLSFPGFSKSNQLPDSELVSVLTFSLFLCVLRVFPHLSAVEISFLVKCLTMQPTLHNLNLHFIRFSESWGLVSLSLSRSILFSSCWIFAFTLLPTPVFLIQNRQTEEIVFALKISISKQRILPNKYFFFRFVKLFKPHQKKKRSTTKYLKHFCFKTKMNSREDDLKYFRILRFYITPKYTDKKKIVLSVIRSKILSFIIFVPLAHFIYFYFTDSILHKLADVLRFFFHFRLLSLSHWLCTLLLILYLHPTS